MAAYHLTADADADLAALYGYSLREFGRAQADRYFLALIDCFEMIAGNPRIGADRSTLKPGYRRFVHEAHVIYYRVRERDVLILRVLGARQDPTRNL